MPFQCFLFCFTAGGFLYICKNYGSQWKWVKKGYIIEHLREKQREVTAKGHRITSKQVDDQIQVKSCAGLASDNHDDKLDAMPYHALV